MKITEAGNTLVLIDASEAEKKRILSAIKEPAPETPELITRRQAGKILNLHPLSLKRYDKAGKLHPIKLTSKTVRYLKSEVYSLLQGVTV